MSRPCFECGVEEGANHEVGCQLEICPFCGQLWSLCGVSKSRLFGESATPCNRLRELSPEDPRRLPYLDFAVYLCSRCGAVEPDLFFLSDAVWEHYVPLDKRDSVLCRPCFDAIVAVMDRVRERPYWCGFLWAPHGPEGEHQFICTKPRGHGGREHGSGKDVWYRHTGRIWPAPDDLTGELR